MYPFIPEGMTVVDMSGGIVATNGGVTGRARNIRLVEDAWLVVELQQAVAHQTTLTPQRCTAADGTGATGLLYNAEIWHNLDCSATGQDSFTRAADAKTYQVSNVAKPMTIIFHIDLRGLGSGYKAIRCNADNSGQATNFVKMQLWVRGNFQGVDQVSLADPS
jgi:hypothetical protein